MTFVHRIACAAVGTVALMVTTTATAQPKYVLTLATSEPKAPLVSVETASWSWGEVQPGSSGKPGAGRAVATATENESSGFSFGAINSGSASRHKYKFGKDNRFTEPHATDGALGLALSPAAARTCARGKHFASATLRGASQVWMLTDVTMAACDADGMVVTYKTATARGHSDKGM